MTDAEILKAMTEGSVTAVLKNTPPVYNDLVKPPTVQLGKALATIVGLVNIPLFPFAWLLKEINEILKDVPEENLQPPSLRILAPSIQQLNYLQDEEEIARLFAELIASAMDKEKSKLIHPGFIDVINNVTPSECFLLREFYKKKSQAFVDGYYYEEENRVYDRYYSKIKFDIESTLTAKFELTLDNLLRLGLLERYDYMSGPLTHGPSAEFDQVIKSEDYQKATEGKKYIPQRYWLILSGFGKQFCDICLRDINLVVDM